MSQSKPSRDWLWVLLAAGVTFFTGLGATRLWDEDEGFFAATAAEMHRRDEWIVPYYNGEVFAHKPPLMYWVMRLGFFTFGENELGARFGSALFGTAASLLTFWVASRLLNRQVGLLAGLAMASCIMFGVVSRAATADAYLVFFMTMVIAAYVRWTPWFGEVRGERLEVSEKTLLPSYLGGFIAMYAAMGLAVLVKGPVGILLPGTSIGLFVLWQLASPEATWGGWLKRFLVNIPRVFWAMRPITAIVTVAAVSGWWFAAVESRTEGGFLGEFIGFHNVQRFLTPMEKHSGPFFIYVPIVWVGFFPWSLFTIPAIATLRSRLSTPATEPTAIREQAAWRLVLCWFSVIFVFFSIAKTKLPNYVLPCYPPLAILIAGFVSRWLSEPAANLRYWGRWAFGSLAAVGLALLVGIPVASQLQIDGTPLLARAELHPDIARQLWPVGLIGLPALVGGVLCWRYLLRDQPRQLLTTFGISSVVFVLGVLGGAATYLDQFQTSDLLADAVHQQQPGEVPLAIYRLHSPSLIYYARQPLEKVSAPSEVEAHLTQANSLLVTTDIGWSQLTPETQQSLEKVYEHPRFPKPGSVMVLKTRETQVARETPSGQGTTR